MEPQVKRKRSRKNKGRKGNQNQINIPGDAQKYTGPLSLPGQLDQKNTDVVQLMVAGYVTSSGGGTLATVYALQLNAFAEYGNLTAIWDEFRLLGAKIKFTPSVQGGIATGVVYNPIGHVVDRDSGAALTSYAATSESYKTTPLNQPFSMTYRMSGSEDAGFVSDVTKAFAWFKIWATNLSATQIFGVFDIRALWQFRGRV